MNKKLFVLLAVIMVLAMVSIPASAAPPDDAGGVWCYVPESMVVDKVAGGNTFYTSTDHGFWSGTFLGESDDLCSSVSHSSGLWWGECTNSFASVTVDGKTGALEMHTIFRQRHPGANWEGSWLITEGTGDLKDLHGQGTLLGPGYNPEDPDNCGEIDYLGNVHFKPD